MDALYTWATALLLPFYAATASLRSEIFILYAALFVFKILKDGYRRSGLEEVTLAAVAGLALSAVGTSQGAVIRHALQVGRILVLPLMMAQCRPVRHPVRILAWGFGALAIYGAIRLRWFPLVTGYAQDRPYCYSDFFMHSSVIAVSGYVFFLILGTRSRQWRIRLPAMAGAMVFLTLVLLHQVRASYLAVAMLTPALLVIAPRPAIALRRLLAMAVLAGVVGTSLWVARPEAMRRIAIRVCSIADPSEGSNRGRLVIWRRAVDVFVANPVNGIGYRRFNRTVVDLGNSEFEWSFAHAHNEWLGMLAETGLIGTLAWLAFKARLAWLLFRFRRTPLGHYALALLAAFEFHVFFEHYLYERTAYIFVYLLIGFCFSALPWRSPCPPVARGEDLT